MRVGIVRHPIYLEHITDDFHPENSQRLVHIYAMLDEISQDGLVYIEPRPATHEEISLVHDVSYIQFVAETKGKAQRRLDPDTVTSPKSYEAACMAAGGFMALGDALFEGRIDNGFALVRPPGHHAERGRAMGFCIFNNIAVGARYLARKYDLKRIMILDWDLHHGNGTQHSFYNDEDILYISTHQYPYYPGTGWFDEVGAGQGKGYTINVPLSAGMADADYVQVLEDIVLPVVRKWKPQLLLVSAGFDIHRNDPLGGMAVTESGFATMTRLLMDAAEELCGGKLLFALEGGYDLSGLTNSVKAVVLQLRKTPLYAPDVKGGPSGQIERTIQQVKKTIEPYWGAL